MRQREIRKERGLSQVQLSYAMHEADIEEKRGYDASFIARVENGQKKPPPRYLRLLGRVLNPTLAELPEFHLAEFREFFDEDVVGLPAALYNLSLAREIKLIAGAEPHLEEDLIRAVEHFAASMPRPPEAGWFQQLAGSSDSTQEDRDEPAKPSEDPPQDPSSPETER